MEVLKWKKRRHKCLQLQFLMSRGGVMNVVTGPILASRNGFVLI